MIINYYVNINKYITNIIKMDRQNYKLTPNEKFISSKLLENLITETDINKAIVEEMNS